MKEGGYPFCGKTETVEHALLLCNWTTCVWFGYMGICTREDIVTTFDRWLQNKLEFPQRADMDKDSLLQQVAFTLWFIWKGGSEATFCESLPHPETVVGRITKAMKEYEEFGMFQKGKQHGKPKQAIREKWQSPAEGQVKINFDAAICKLTWKGSLGVVARDHHGLIVAGVEKAIKAVDPLIAEALAVKEGVLLAVAKGWTLVLVELESSILCCSLEKQETVPW